MKQNSRYKTEKRNVESFNNLFFDSHADYLMRGRRVDYLLRNKEIQRGDIAKIIVDDESSGVNSKDAALRLIRDLVNEKGGHSMDFMKSLNRAIESHSKALCEQKDHIVDANDMVNAE